MAYNFLSLTNEVNRRLNEVELTDANFSTAKGFYSQVKDGINSAIRDINHICPDWPFNHVLAEEILTSGITRYGFPSDAGLIDFDSFRLKEDTSLGNATVKLNIISYEDYLEGSVDQEYSSDSSKRGVPSYVFHAPGYEWGVVPAPDQAYEIVYEYYRSPVDLEKPTDVPTVPERFRHVIVDGAMYHAYMFRSNEQAASIAKSKFDDGIKRMRIMLVNRYDYVRSTAVRQSSYTAFGDRVK